MSKISANIRLRPTRIGFLVKPNDFKSILKIMQINACLWGGAYNPIIPVYKTPPKEWRARKHERVRGVSVVRGYINFFEPDVYVEAQKGLLEEAGLEKIRSKYATEQHIITLNELLKVRDSRDYSEPAMGLNVTDILRHLYKTEQRFEHRDKISSLIIRPESNTGLVEAVFGSYPKQKHAAYIQQGYKDVFLPETLNATPESWLKVFQDNARTPLKITRHGLEFQQYWYHDPIIYVFDPSRPTDLIDLWNLRLEPCPVLPVPFKWVEELSEFLRSIIEQQHRPLKGNPHGVMHNCTIEVSRSIPKENIEEIIDPIVKGMPEGAISIKDWRTPIWEPKDFDRMRGPELLKITAAEESRTISTKEEKNEITASFKALYPDFASRYGGRGMRWINALQVGAYGPKKIATVLPYNTYNREWPQLGFGAEQIMVGKEGWIYGQRYKDMDDYMNLLTKEDAVIGALKQLGVEAKLSDPGHIAKQVLDRMGGLWGVHLLANPETIQLLNFMSGAVRRKKNNEGSIEEVFQGRTATVKKWADIINKNSKGSLRDPKIKDYTDRNVIKLGIESACPHCQGKNWHSLDLVDYNISCERCLNEYEFPQAEDKERNWKYRVIGPFSTPDFARGSYSSLLTLRAIDTLGMGRRGEMTFSNALDLTFDRIKCEADFVAYRDTDKTDESFPPELIIGETKSFGKGDLVKLKDLTKLRHLAKKMPNSVIVISVMRDHFTENEIKILKPFVKWSRRENEQGRVTNPVILFTGHELFVDHLISSTWEKLGKPHSDYTDYNHTKDLYSLAQATQAIYLKIPSFYDTKAAKHKKKKSVVKKANNEKT